jgi:predicted small metal-binding protein
MRQSRPVERVSTYYTGETVEQVLQKAAEHAKEHGIREVTPELMERVKAYIRDA